MPPYHRVFVAACVLASLFYIYWQRLTVSDTLRSFGVLTNASIKDVFNNTLGFSRIIVINLPSRKDRRDAIALAGSVSDLNFTWVDGVSGEEVLDRATRVRGGRHAAGAKGSWRSHMNALQSVVQENLTSALILEDDIDWDVRLKSQLRTFASASRTWLRESNSGRPQIQLPPITSVDSEVYQTAYGDGWDVLWLGHCGADFPDDRTPISPLIVEIPEDETVPAPKHLKPHAFALQDKLGEMYSPHTRVVHASSGNICSLAYAVSQQGAQKLLSRFHDRYDTQWDLMLQKWCEGNYTTESKSRPDSEINEDSEIAYGLRASPPICLTVQPPLFSHHYAEGGASNIQGQGGGYAKGKGTPYIRFSVRQNLERLVAGAPESEMIDQLPDDGEAIWK